MFDGVFSKKVNKPEAEPKPTQERLNEKLVSAIERNDLELARSVIKQGADVNFREGFPIDRYIAYNIPLITAIRKNNNMEVINLLLEKGAKFNNINVVGEAALRNRLDVLEVFVAKGLNFDDVYEGEILGRKIFYQIRDRDNPEFYSNHKIPEITEFIIKNMSSVTDLIEEVKIEEEHLRIKEEQLRRLAVAHSEKMSQNLLIDEKILKTTPLLKDIEKSLYLKEMNNKMSLVASGIKCLQDLRGLAVSERKPDSYSFLKEFVSDLSCIKNELDTLKHMAPDGQQHKSTYKILSDQVSNAIDEMHKIVNLINETLEKSEKIQLVAKDRYREIDVNGYVP